jgi:hypothetical protein
MLRRLYFIGGPVKLSLLSVVGIALFLYVPLSRADAYYGAGANFNRIGAIYGPAATCVDPDICTSTVGLGSDSHLFGSVWFTDPIPDGFRNPTALGWSLSDGITTIDNTNTINSPSFFFFVVGDFVVWNTLVETITPKYHVSFSISEMDGFTAAYSDLDGNFLVAGNGFGTWGGPFIIPSEVPEPATILLGMLAMCIISVPFISGRISKRPS